MKIEVNFNKNKNDTFNPACDEENIYASFYKKQRHSEYYLNKKKRQ